ncbi:MAG: hypothetical protein KHZ24_11605 [Coriobacteriia bacterium]|nr:hypothetical protein [Coriobacteriia bacterium]
MPKKVFKALLGALTVYGVVCVVVSIVGTVNLLSPNAATELAARGTTVYQGILAAVSLEIGGLVTIVLSMLGLAGNFALTKTRLYRFVLALLSVVNVAAFIACIVGRAHIAWALFLALGAVGVCVLCFKMVADEKKAAQAAKQVEAARKQAEVARREQAAAAAVAAAQSTKPAEGGPASR